jgi:carbon storage regulator CsrA
MLVLARQLNERIVMPTVPATIEVVSIKPNGVRLGIEAAPEVTILREEVLRRGSVSANELLTRTQTDAVACLHRLQHILRNRLQTVALGLDLIGGQMERGDTTELPEMCQRLHSEVCRLDRQLRAALSSAVDPASSALCRRNSESAVEFSI